MKRSNPKKTSRQNARAKERELTYQVYMIATIRAMSQKNFSPEAIGDIVEGMSATIDEVMKGKTTLDDLIDKVTEETNLPVKELIE